MSTSIRKTVSKSPITLDKISKGEFQKEDTLTAQIRQVVTTHSFYPSKKVDSNMQDTIFSAEEFGFGEQEYISEEVRMAWILVPTDATEQKVKDLLAVASKNGGCIYKVLSNKPIIDDNQQYSINVGQKTLDSFADTQVSRYPENEKTIADGTANKLILDKAGNPQYRRTFYSRVPKEDMDVRNPADVYMSLEIQAELQGANVFTSQSI